MSVITVATAAPISISLMFDAARGYATRGFYVFPVPPGTEKSHVRGKVSEGIPKWYDAEPRQDQELLQKRSPRANIGIVLDSFPKYF